ncbi:MAG: hypothetical protein NTV51_14115 [Verrucomicrobia bacterium]|nr:hypothetical protein [Verrucomicrobiota bacterium]
MSPKLFDELGVAGAILLTMAGLGLHVYRANHRMTVEERVKDSRMTEAEARRQMKFYALCAPVVSLLGVGLLALALYDMAQ